jgi:hypothetical protein
VIYDEKSGALYADDGTFLKTVFCPLAVRVQDLDSESASSRERHCHACGDSIRSADEMTDADLKAALEEDGGLCVFITPKAMHVVMLKAIGRRNPNAEGLPVVRSVRSLPAMEDGFQRGFRLVLKHAGPVSDIGAKYKVYQHKLSGEVWWTGDYRAESPADGSSEDWELVADWFHHRVDWPFPLAAYLVPRGLKRGQRVYLEDVIEDVPVAYWNQGDSDRLVSCNAVWNGDGFDFERFDAPPCVVG